MVIHWPVTLERYRLMGALLRPRAESLPMEAMRLTECLFATSTMKSCGSGWNQ